MAEVLLLHHALGLTPGIEDLAGALRGQGHTVHVPDLYAGRTFDDLEQGVAHAQEVGFGEVAERGRAAAEALPEHLVYVGLSLGVVPAQALAQTRLGARGAVLLHSCLPAARHGGWPAGVPVQVHAMERDPWFVDDGDLEAARALVDEAADGELHLYPGDGHLFLERGRPEHDQQAAALCLSRVLALLERVG